MEVLNIIFSALGGASALGCLAAAVAAYFKAKAAELECQVCRDELVKVRELVGDANALREENEHLRTEIAQVRQSRDRLIIALPVHEQAVVNKIGL